MARKTVFRITGVVMCVILTFYLLIHVTYCLRDYTNLMGFYDLPKDKADVVFVGTSVTLSTFMPMQAWEEYGMACADYCTNGMMETTMPYAVRDVMRTQKPKLLMIDIAPFMYGHYAGNPNWTRNNGVDAGDYIYEFSKCNLDAKRYYLDRFSQVYEINRDRGGTFTDYWFWFFDIARCHNKKFKIDQFFNTMHDVNKGYVHLPHNEGGYTDPAEFVDEDGSVTAITGWDLKYLDKLADTVKSLDSDTQVVFYCAPVFFVRRNDIGRKNFIREYMAANGLNFVDFTPDRETIGIDPETDLWGLDHYDALGAAKVTEHLCKYIDENHDIPDRRGDADYSYWADDVAAWDELYKGYVEKDLAQ